MKYRLNSVAHFKNLAKSLMRGYGVDPLARAQEAVARMLGYRDAHEALHAHKERIGDPAAADAALAAKDIAQRNGVCAKRLGESLSLDETRSGQIVAALAPFGRRDAVHGVVEAERTLFGELESRFGRYKNFDIAENERRDLLCAALDYLEISGALILHARDVRQYVGQELCDLWSEGDAIEDVPKMLRDNARYMPKWFPTLNRLVRLDDGEEMQDERDRLYALASHQVRVAIEIALRAKGPLAEAMPYLIETANGVIMQAAAGADWDGVWDLAEIFVRIPGRWQAQLNGPFEREVLAGECLLVWRAVAAIQKDQWDVGREILATLATLSTASEDLQWMARLAQLDRADPDAAAVAELATLDTDALQHLREMFELHESRTPPDLTEEARYYCDTGIAPTTAQHLFLVASSPVWETRFGKALMGIKAKPRRRRSK